MAELNAGTPTSAIQAVNALLRAHRPVPLELIRSCLRDSDPASPEGNSLRMALAYYPTTPLDLLHGLIPLLQQGGGQSPLAGPLAAHPHGDAHLHEQVLNLTHVEQYADLAVRGCRAFQVRLAERARQALTGPTPMSSEWADTIRALLAEGDLPEAEAWAVATTLVSYLRRAQPSVSKRPAQALLPWPRHHAQDWLDWTRAQLLPTDLLRHATAVAFGADDEIRTALLGHIMTHPQEATSARLLHELTKHFTALETQQVRAWANSHLRVDPSERDLQRWLTDSDSADVSALIASGSAEELLTWAQNRRMGTGPSNADQAVLLARTDLDSVTVAALCSTLWAHTPGLWRSRPGDREFLFAQLSRAPGWVTGHYLTEEGADPVLATEALLHWVRYHGGRPNHMVESLVAAGVMEQARPVILAQPWSVQSRFCGLDEQLDAHISATLSELFAGASTATISNSLWEQDLPLDQVRQMVDATLS